MMTNYPFDQLDLGDAFFMKSNKKNEISIKAMLTGAVNKKNKESEKKFQILKVKDGFEVERIK